jgi:hypothetical protein
MTRGNAHLVWIKDKSSDVAMSFDFDVTDSFWCGDTSDNNVSLLLKFDNQGKAQRVIPAQHDLKVVSDVRGNPNEYKYTPTTCRFSGVTVVDLSLRL